MPNWSASRNQSKCIESGQHMNAPHVRHLRHSRHFSESEALICVTASRACVIALRFASHASTGNRIALHEIASVRTRHGADDANDGGADQ